ncbi:MAG: SDR family NAD(P)-dependent oxidoreductase [Bacteroidia bacterium]
MVKRVLITGGSSGIGFAISKKFAEAGYGLLWVSEDARQLEEAATKFRELFPDINLHCHCADLSDMDACDGVFQWANQIGPLEVLVNCAGFGTFGQLHEIDEERELQMIRLNVLATYRLTRLFANTMLEQGSGKIANVASNTALQPVPRMSTYAATKAFVKHFSQSLYEEFKGTGVTVTTIIPSATTGTGFQNRSGMSGVKTFQGLLAAEVEEVANYSFEAIMKGAPLVYASRRLRWTRPLASLLPSKVIQWLVAKELRKV